jgi:VWFA-related protein
VVKARPARKILLLALLLAVPMAHGSMNTEENEPPGRDPLPSGITEEVEVMLFQVNFLAMDRSGRPITDLEAEEVRIFDQGKPQQIAFFEPYYRIARPAIETQSDDGSELPAPPSRETAAEPTGASPGRWIVLFFDNYASSLSTRVQSIEAAERYVDEQLRPEDLVCVVSFTGDLHVLQDFTNDGMELKRAFQRAIQQTDRAIVNRYDELDYLMEAMERCKGQSSAHICARRVGGAYEDERRREADAMLRALIHLLRSLSSIPDIKTLVLFSNGIARSSTSDPIDAARATLGDDVADRIFFGHEYDIDKWYDELVTAAVQSRISVFTINPGGATRNYLISSERSSPLNEAVDTFQVDVYGRSDRNYQSSLSEMAKRTGGTSTQKSDVLGALSEMLELSSGLYSVGYYPNRPIPSAPHDVKIRLKRKRAKAVWPRDVPHIPTAPPLLGEMALTPEACSEGGRRALTVTLRLEVDSLMFESFRKQFSNDFSVFLSILDEEGVRTLHRDYRFFNISHSAEEHRRGGLEDPVIEQTLIVPCRPLIVRASAVDSVSGARVEFDQQLPQ